jgi:hypothetical protein
MTGQKVRMRSLLPLALLAFAAPAAAADRSFTITDFNRVRIEGPFKVTLTTNRPPFAKARSSSRAALDRVSIEVQGRTLVIKNDRSAWGGYPGEVKEPVEIALGTHDLASAWVNGAGSVSIDRVRGLTFDLSVEGAGAGSIGHAEVDNLRLLFAGTATGQVAGRAPKLSAHVRGASSLDITDLATKDALIAADGPAMVKATVSGTAKVDAYGSASVQLAGRPACTVRAHGSASVSGCK